MALELATELEAIENDLGCFYPAVAGRLFRAKSVVPDWCVVNDRFWWTNDLSLTNRGESTRRNAPAVVVRMANIWRERNVDWRTVSRGGVAVAVTRIGVARLSRVDHVVLAPQWHAFATVPSRTEVAELALHIASKDLRIVSVASGVK